MSRVLQVVVSLVASMFAVPAQTVWIVDRANNPGTNFTDIQPAIDAAAPGDVVFVRHGSYHGFVVDKSLSVVAQEGGAVLREGGPMITVRDLPPGGEVAVRGFVLLSTNTIGVDLRDNRGLVLVDGLRVLLGALPTTITDCDQVVVSDCDLTGEISVTRSGVVFADSRSTGSLEEPAISAQDSTLFLANTSVFGGGSVAGSGAPALALQNSAVTAAGDGSVGLHGGRNIFIPSSSSNVIVGDGTLRLDPDVPIVPFGAGLQISGSFSVATEQLALLTANQALLSAPSQVDLFAQPGESFFLFAGAPGPTVVVPGLGELWLDPLRMVLVHAGVVGSTGQETFGFQVPNQQVLLGRSVFWTGLVVGSTTQITNLVGQSITR